MSALSLERYCVKFGAFGQKYRNYELPLRSFFCEYVIESYNQKMATYLEETCVLDGRNGTLYLKYDVTLFIA